MIHNLIANLKLNAKLLLAFGSILFLSVVITLTAVYTSYVGNRYHDESENIDELLVNLLEIDATIKAFIGDGYKEKDFQTTGKSKSLTEYQVKLEQSTAHIAKLGVNHITVADTASQRMTRTLNKINQQVLMLSGYLKDRGFKDFGLEGELRKAIHEVDKYNHVLDRADILTLRRHEKDFFLRKDLKYRDEFNKKIDQVNASVEIIKDAEVRAELFMLLKRYQSKFNRVVELEEIIGLQQDGLVGAINRDLTEIRNLAVTIRSEIKAEQQAFNRSANLILVLLVSLQIIVGTLMALFYARQLSSPIKQLQTAISQFAGGVLPGKLQVTSRDEIGQFKQSFNQLVDRIEAAQNFSGEMGKGNLNSVYPDAFKGDLLAQSLIVMQRQLSVANETQRIINWSNLGSAQLNEILKVENENLELLAARVIKMVVKYFNANQGAIYLAKYEGQIFYAERIATYAYDKRKFVDQRIEAGQGIIGQCLLERATILLTEVPPKYVKITSGLGDATPSFIVVVPLIIRENLMGMIELASFEVMQKYQIEFLEKLGENIASILLNKKSAEDTQSLLNEARERAEELAAQEEEIRQNAEEMQAITEQLDREKKILEEEIKELRGHAFSARVLN